jgi:TolB-like protein/Tfp pilus assembly protein PilF
VSADLLSEVVRLEPDNEMAVRAALRADHALGDSAGLRRRYLALRERLRNDYGAEPAAETVELFNQLSSGRVPAQGASPRREEAPATSPSFRTAAWKLAALAAAVVVLAVVSLLYMTREEARASAASETVLLAVLPFEQDGPPAGYLAEGLWDDTRSAIARNGGLRLLGRATMEAAARQRLTPRQLRKRFGATHLLEGIVRQAGKQVRVSVSLTRTSDGAAIWEDSFLAPAGDSLALQGRIAEGIEGRLRGRLAPGGGRRPEQIVTTPTFYALYSEGRSLIHARKPSQMARARKLLQRAVELDANFAPAWSSLAAATYFESSGAAGAADKDRRALHAARRAIALAPNLAEAHATLALIEGDNSPASEAPLRRALALDPGYAEAWNWLGNALSSQSRANEAVAAYKRALDLDPLWSTPALNLLSVARDAGDGKALGPVLAKLSASGADNQLIHTLQAEDRLLAGDYSAALKLLLLDGNIDERQSTTARVDIWIDVLTRLGYPEAATRHVGAPDWYAAVVRSQRPPPTSAGGKAITAADFWEMPCLFNLGGRALVNLGQSNELVRLYRERFGDADGFISELRPAGLLVNEVPTLAVALRSTGRQAEADYLLAAAATRAETAVRIAPQSADRIAMLAYVRAAQGQHEQAVQMLAAANARGWLPDGRYYAIDLAQEPAFAAFRRDRRFQALRKRVLDHIASERAEFGPLTI